MVSPRTAEIVDGFSRQAKSFARSPLHRDEGRLRRLVDFAGPVPGERGLDVACGPAFVARALAARGVRMAGSDLTREMLREAAAAGAGTPQAGVALVLVQAEAERLPFAEGVFGLVVCRNAFHHFTQPEAIFREMARVTRPGGRVVIEDMIAPEDLVERDEQEVIERLRDRTHARTLAPSEFRTMVARAGLAWAEALEFELVLDFDEWMDRAFPAPWAKERSRRLLEDALAAPRGGRRVWIEEGRLRFARRSLLLRAART